MAAAAAAAEMVFHMCTNLGDYLSFIIHAFRKHKITGAGNQICLYSSNHELPVDLMEIILNRLDLIDRHRTSMVCKSWRRMEKDIRLHPQLPWLLFPNNSTSKSKSALSLYDLSHNKIRDLKLPKPIHDGGRCCGSSKGWLIIAKETLVVSEIFLFNPFSGAIHTLPSLATLECFNDNVHHFSDPCNAHRFIVKIELSSTDLSNCTVAAIFRNGRKLAFCKVGGKSWSMFYDDSSKHYYYYIDILFSNETLLYVLKMLSDEEEEEGVEECRFIDFEVSMKIIPYRHRDLNIFDDNHVEYHDEDFSIIKEADFYLYLVENNNGELLLIKRIMDYFESMYYDVYDDEAEDEDDDVIAIDDDLNEDEEDDIGIHYNINDEYYYEDDSEWEDEEEDEYGCNLGYYRTRRFEVYRIDPTTGISSMTRLPSLGSQVLFLSGSSSSFVQAKDFIGTLQENCIYFVEDCSYLLYENHPLISRESGIFYLDDDKIQRSFPSVQLPLHSSMCWFTPTP